jgi:hypothetical protein
MSELPLNLPARGLAAELRARMAGPGGYYNLGNALGLVMGLGTEITAASSGSQTAALVGYFAGTAGSTALTLATLVFFFSGEVYHRAWAGRQAPDRGLNRLGDFLSGVGAIALGVALFLFGEPLLAATSGLLHAVGKFGSALHPAEVSFPGWPANWPDPFRTAVLASRLPAILAAAITLSAALSGAAVFASLVAPLTLLGCYLLWTKADILLFRSATL